MALAVEATCVRAVVKNTFVHVENIGNDIGCSRRINRRKSDALHVRPSALSAILLELGSPVEPSNRVRVKNSFVDVAKEQVEGEVWESCHVRRKSRRLESDSFHSCQEGQDEEAQNDDVPGLAPETHCRHELFVSETSSWSTCSEHEEGKNKIVPRESAGSIDHAQGSCRPCVWFWRPTSCNKGSNCEYCHLCDEGAVARAMATKKAMKKEKVKATNNLKEETL